MNFFIFYFLLFGGVRTQTLEIIRHLSDLQSDIQGWMGDISIFGSPTNSHTSYFFVNKCKFKQNNSNVCRCESINQSIKENHFKNAQKRIENMLVRQSWENSSWQSRTWRWLHNLFHTLHCVTYMLASPATWQTRTECQCKQACGQTNEGAN